ncbi:hypothetical protein PQO01_17435 [Lentisphaera marina]|uniref:hypothetical protein n=1 Tax=Lentisphaera marina TaxID=1111041 RepID=UPI0023658984|nr:hypothetical protein [Lentisphaera marina]MDD7986735.1 hypothetical protein [Lentisphaera marina]
MKLILFALLSLFYIQNSYGQSDTLYLDLNDDLKFDINEQNSWIKAALIEFEKYSVRGSSRTQQKLELIFSSDIDKNNEIDKKELRIIRARLASICAYYEQYFKTEFGENGQISSSQIKKIKSKYSSMIPGYDLVDPFKESNVNIEESLTPIYF